MLKKIREDLWETQGESPFPGLTTHAYLWTPPFGGNVLFYSTVTDGDFDEIERLGGVAHQYLSHHDEAGPMVREIARRFGARLHAGRGDAKRIANVAPSLVEIAVGACLWPVAGPMVLTRSHCSSVPPSRRRSGTGECGSAHRGGPSEPEMQVRTALRESGCQPCLLALIRYGRHLQSVGRSDSVQLPRAA
jgi:hypothetical protein